MSDYVWVSGIMVDYQLELMVETDISDRNETAAIQGARLNRAGKPVPSELCPKKIWGLLEADEWLRMPADNMPDVFFARCQWIVSSRAAAVLSKFDLGGGALYPVSEGVFREDQTTRLPDDYLCWTFGNEKSVFLPDQSSGKEPSGLSGTHWYMGVEIKDDMIAVSKGAFIGPSVWIDAIFNKGLFLSRELGDAIADAGLSEAFRLHKARVI